MHRTFPREGPYPLFVLLQVIAHGPAAGLADGGMGCEALRSAMARVRPRAVVSGHIHDVRGAGAPWAPHGRDFGIRGGRTKCVNSRNHNRGNREGR